MKVKVDGITFEEFNEYINSGFARQINMTLYIFLAIVSLGVAFGLITDMGEDTLKPLFICAGVLLILIISSKMGTSFVYKKSGLSDTPCRYSFDQYGMDITMGKLSGDLGWEHVKHVTETDNLWIIRASNSQFILPKRCFDSGKLKDIIIDSLPENKIKNREEKRGKDRRKGNPASEGNNGASEKNKR